MTTDLLGLTIHIAPENGFDAESRLIKQTLWEGREVSEQFEQLLLNSCHRILYRWFADEATPISQDDIRIEVVGKYDDESLEEWFAVGVELRNIGDVDVIRSKILADSAFSQLLCRTLEAEIKTLFVQYGLIRHLLVNVEVTGYAEMWS